MYFPVLRGKRFELHAVRDLRDVLVDWNTVVPIIEPVRRGGLGIALDALVGDGVQFAFIVNPQLGEFADNPRAIEADFITEYLDEYDNYIPTLYVDRRTTSRQIADFAGRFDIPTAFFVVAQPTNETLRSLIAAQPAYVALRDGRVATATRDQLRNAHTELIEVTDPFVRRVRNSDYPDSEFFSDRFATIDPDAIYSHFGDYSIVGDAYAEGGGAAYTVALHHVVATEENVSLEILHYKSDPSDSTTNVAGKFAEALGRLIENQSDASGVNDTRALEVYRELDNDEHFPGLGFAKKLGLMQHIEVVARLLADE